MSDVLFEEKSEAEVKTPETPALKDDALNLDSFAHQLMEIKNERGEPKYDSLSKALDALKHSQEYIPQLKSKTEEYEAELARLREELAKREAVEDVVSRLSQQRPPEVPQPTSEAPKALDEAAVEQMLQRALTQREKQKLAQDNMSAVRSALSAKFGDKAPEEVKAVAQKFGMTMEQISALSATSPSAVLAWFNASPSAPSAAPVRSTVTLPDAAPPSPLKKPERSMLRGASSKEQAEFMRKIREEVYKRNGIDL